MNIIDEVIRLYSESESPESYFYWSTIAALSAVSRRNVWINKRGVYKLYPCMYIMLVGKSGIKKGLPVKVAKKLVTDSDATRIIDGRNSIQAIMEELSHQISTPSGKVFNTGECFIVNDELGSLLIKDPHGQLILTTLFDCFYHDSWMYKTKSGGPACIKKPGITLLTASNKAHLDEFLDPDSIIGGFIGRTNIIHADSGNSSGSDLLGESDEEDSLVSEIDISHIVDHLKLVNQVTGQFKIESAARKLWKVWYKEIREAVNSGSIEDETGTVQRIHDNALKLAMLLSLAERFDLIITESHMEEAILKSVESFQSVKMIVAGKGKSDDSDKTRILLEYLITQPNFCATRHKILKAKYKDIDGITLTKIIDTIGPTGARIIKVANTNEGQTYQLDESWVSQFTNKPKSRVIVND